MPSRATGILPRKRALTLPMIRKIAKAWHVPDRHHLGAMRTQAMDPSAKRKHLARSTRNLP